MTNCDLLYIAINNYFAIQTMNSFCTEAILERDIKDAQKIQFDMYSKLTRLFECDSSVIDEACENLYMISKLNINCFTNFCAEQLDDEEKTDFKHDINLCLKKYFDEKENFIFTIDAYYDIMKLYWKFEKISVIRRFENEHK